MRTQQAWRSQSTLAASAGGPNEDQRLLLRQLPSGNELVNGTKKRTPTRAVAQTAHARTCCGKGYKTDEGTRAIAATPISAGARLFHHEAFNIDGE